MKKNISKLIIAGIIIILSIIFYYGYQHFNVAENFTPISYNFDPTDSSSTYNWEGAEVKIQGGFVKGTIIDDRNIKNLVLRSLSPTPVITVKNNGNSEGVINIQVENVNPVNINVQGSKIKEHEVLDPHTLGVTFNLKQGETGTVEVIPDQNSGGLEFIVLGDNRNGYQTFSQIIDQINTINPAFVIDNGDLVYGGEPNKYRLFNETVSKLRVPLYTTLGNHDIRENGRTVYTELFGPPYYSFDYDGCRFIFLDSSRGWAEKRAITEEQYVWLEKMLAGASAQKIFVFTHIPSTDPRDNLEKNSYPDEPGIQKQPFFERLLNDYAQNKSKDHGFPDPKEAARFEKLMEEYKVDTVFTSHIHSYFSFEKNGVNYIISGGAGAELLTTDSYYHYMRVRISGEENHIEIVQLPSPTNIIQERFLAAGILFANSIYKEYKTTVILIGVFLAFMLFWLLFRTYHRWGKSVKFIVGWLIDVVQYAFKRFKDRKAVLKKAKNTDKQ